MTEPAFEPRPAKDAEKHEKESEKESEKSRLGDEKRWDEKVRRDPFGPTLAGLILLWSGLVLLAGNLGWLGPLAGIPSWSLILVGAGAILLLGIAYVLLVPAYRRPIGGLLVLALLLLLGGVGFAFGLALLAPALLIAVGVLILARALRR